MASNGRSRRRALGTAERAHLAAAMAHEVRNPLNAMAIQVELLGSRIRELTGGTARHGEKAEQAARSLTVLRQEIARIDGLLERYLRNVGPEERDPQASPVAPTVRACIEAARESARRRGVVLDWSAPDDGPGGEAAEAAKAAGAAEAEARWPLDEEIVTLALGALIDNAIAASPKGGHVRVRAFREPRSEDGEERGIIEVSDDGEGIEAEALVRVHEFGYTTRRGCTGIGLTLARQAIKSFGGSLVVTSAGPGKGTTARIEIPFEEVDQDD